MSGESPTPDSARELSRLMAGIVNVREYTLDPVPPADMLWLMEAFRLGPSLANTQPCEVIRVTGLESRRLVAASTLDAFLRPGTYGAQGWLRSAPELLVVVLELRRAQSRLGSRGSEVAREHAFAAIQNLRLMAASLGLATSCVIEFDSARLASAVGLPWYVEAVAIVSLGYPRGAVEQPERLSVADLLREESWQRYKPSSWAEERSVVPEPGGGDVNAITPGVLPERHSVRRFLSDPVPTEVMVAALEDATRAPSSGNMQPWEFLVVDDHESKEKLVATTYSGYEKNGPPQLWMRTAPLIVAVCANLKRTRARYGPDGDTWSPLDAAAAAQNLLLSLAARGLGSCWVGGFRVDEVSRVLGLTEYVRPIGLFPVGYAAEEPAVKPRLPVGYVTHLNRFDAPYLVSAAGTDGKELGRDERD